MTIDATDTTATNRADSGETGPVDPANGPPSVAGSSSAPEVPASATAGERIAQERARHALTIEDLSAQSYIRATLIRNIEADDFRLCGGGCYARGHLRILGQVLHLEPGPLIEAYDRDHAETDGPADPSSVNSAEPVPPLAVRTAPRRPLVLGSCAAGAVLAIAMVLLTLMR